MQSVKSRFQSATVKEKKEGDFLKLGIGKTEIRVLPKEYGKDNLPFILFNQHYHNGEYLKCKGEGCPLCSEGWSNYRSNSKSMTPEIKKLLPSQKAMMNVLVDGKHKVLTISQKQLEEILDLEDSEKLFELDGKTLIIKRTGENLLTKYSYQIGKGSKISPIDEVGATDLDDVIGQMKST